MSNEPSPASTVRERVGFIGLGVMGAPMAGHLARAGHAVSVYDLAPGAAQRLAESQPGITARASLREVAAHSDVIVTMLPNGRVVREVVFADDGLLAGWARGGLLLDTSSAEPWITRETAARLAEHGIAMVDAPVSGAAWGAQAAELVFMVGGAQADVARARPLLDAMGRAVFHLGALGAGHTMKCLNNLITAVTLTATAEGLAIGTRAGLDPAVMTDVLNEATGGSWITRTHIHQRVISRSFDDPFKLELMLKDMGIAVDLARELGMPAPISEEGRRLWQQADAARGPGVSVSELVRWVETEAGTEIRSATSPR
ncbi:6-phosphogluconate dehydrogenase [Variovorax paradoxus]|jgi:3-hydroxyisobutyrate dehydrogenase|uniref:NAD(P)-dependent oxidoreductase n=1 Tax=Variovorax paradoxus TaxID=34073 RepID=UPI0006E6B8CB|nr:6-phosphogluconate dehydrogenase [Variovorax paradoxus]KPV02108.1 6-phosphogluconate dehydrogenase [Variovorax paradoxus]KPV02855.1 6-phosphogluconate dehydrogenase [Variovorax paradoxus]KPV14540.1 6-phosphogluconate dehydrogenase [Variovorax paradoxus]KPV28530.1 6-phosphogluconate dehydrogenase [Variovorax paradoxus]